MSDNDLEHVSACMLDNPLIFLAQNKRQAKAPTINFATDESGDLGQTTLDLLPRERVS